LRPLAGTLNEAPPHRGGVRRVQLGAL